MSAQLKAISTVTLAAAAAVAATANGAAKDLRAFDGDLALVLTAGTPSGTNPTLDVKIQHSNDGTTWTDSGVAFAQVTAASEQRLNVTAEQFHRYIRVVDTVGGTSTPTIPRAVVLVGRLR